MKNQVIETPVEAEARKEVADSGLASGLLDLITGDRTSVPRPSIDGVVVGKLAGFDSTGGPIVNYVTDYPREHIVARSIIALREDQLGSDVVLAFDQGDPRKPIVTGALWQPENSERKKPVEIELDGERLLVSAKKEIVLRCGKASITLTQAGKILIKGAYLLSRSSGANRIKGASIQLN